MRNGPFEFSSVRYGDMAADVYVMFLVVTTDCMFDCAYCFVKKGAAYMDLDTAKRGVDLLMNTRGKRKLLKIYGGEPLMDFRLIEKVVPYAERLAEKKGKDLTITICSNMVLFDDRIVRFVRKHGISLALSSDGAPRSHDSNRKFKKGAGSSGIIESKMGLLLENLSREKLAINLTVPNGLVSESYGNFRYLTGLGMNTFNVEPIMSDAWTESQASVFRREYGKILDFALASAEGKDPVFVTQVNRELRYGEITEMMRGDCILKRNLIVSPNGDLHLNVFAAYSEKLGTAKRVGNVNAGIFSEHFACRVGSGVACRECISGYAEGVMRSNAPNGIRNELTLKAVKSLRVGSEEKASYRRYVRQAKRQICF